MVRGQRATEEERQELGLLYPFEDYRYGSIENRACDICGIELDMRLYWCGSPDLSATHIICPECWQKIKQKKKKKET